MTFPPSNQPSPALNTMKTIDSHSDEGTVGSVIALCFVMLIAITGNVAIIVIFRVYKRLRKQVTNHFLINLAISDLIVALVTMPFWMSFEINRWESVSKPTDRELLERIWTFTDIACEASSIANLAVISIDRLYSVSNPFKHRTTVTPSLAHRIIFAVWGYAIAVASVYLIDTKWKTIIICVFGFAIPLGVMIVCYSKIVTVVRLCRKRWSQNPEANKHFFGSIVNEYKTAKSLGVVMVAFVICWLPFFVFSFFFSYCEKCLPWLMKRPAIPAVTKWLHYLNSALNPILYTMFNPSYRVVFRRLIAWCLRKEYQCTRYEAWYLGSRRISVSSQRSSSLNHPLAGYRNSNSSIYHRPSCGSVVQTRPESKEIPKDFDDANNEVFINASTNTAVLKDVNGNTDGDVFENNLTVRPSANKNRVSFSDSGDTIL